MDCFHESALIPAEKRRIITYISFWLTFSFCSRNFLRVSTFSHSLSLSIHSKELLRKISSILFRFLPCLALFSSHSLLPQKDEKDDDDDDYDDGDGGGEENIISKHMEHSEI